MFEEILFFDPKWPFCKGYSLSIVAIFPIFKIVSFLEYELFFGAVFGIERL